MYIPEMPVVTQSLLPIESNDFKDFKVIAPHKQNDVDIIIVNFLRDKLLFNLVKSIFQYYPGCKIYIAEQGVFNKSKEIFYSMLEGQGHEIIYCGFDAGISVCRNSAIERAKEPYICILDEDNLFLPETDIRKLKQILESNPKIGLVGMAELFNGEINHYEVNLEIKNRKVFYNKAWPFIEGKEFYYRDMMMNCFLARRELFNINIYDERLKLCEHLSSFLTIKYKTDYKCVWTTIPIANQNIDIKNPLYDAYRKRNKTFWQYYKEIWNVDSLVGLDGKQWDIEIFKAPKKDKLPDKKEQFQEPDSDILKKLFEFSNILENDNIPFFLMDKTCLEYVKGISFSNPLYLGIKLPKDVYDKLTLNGYQYHFTTNSFTKDGIDIKILSEVPLRYKQYNKIEGRSFNIPVPVVSYLQRTFRSRPEWNIYKLKDLK